MDRLVSPKVAQILVVMWLSGCGEQTASSIQEEGHIELEKEPVTGGSWYRPPVLATWQWQLTGVINRAYSVNVYDIDLFDSTQNLVEELQSDNAKVICYFSAGSYEEWRSDANQFAPNELGNTLDGWAGERWLDIRSNNVVEIMKARLDMAVAKGCDGVEPDNVDGYQNESGFNLTAQDQLDFNRTLANEAHIRNLSVGLKNDLEQVNQLVDYFDFAVNEECFQYNECELLTPFIDSGKAVFNVEYEPKYINDENAKQVLCTQSLNRQFSTLILPTDLDDEFRISCL